MAADILDATQEIEQKLLDLRLAAIRAGSGTRQLPPKGACHWCDERFTHGSEHIFCDADCSEDYEKYHRK